MQPDQLEKLQALLRDDCKKKIDNAEDGGDNETKQGDGAAGVGVSALNHWAPEIWRRDIDPRAYTCPRGPSLTTLIPWSSLTRQQQQQQQEDILVDPNIDDDHSRMVEIRTPAEVSPADPEASNTNTTRRPRVGNLSDKLSEYTRGVTGQARPFRPGGGPEEEGDIVDDGDPARTPAAVERAHVPLQCLHTTPTTPTTTTTTTDDDDTTARRNAWQQGNFLTAPPGVTFRVGLSWTDVYKEENAPDLVEPLAARMHKPAVAASRTTTATPAAPPTIVTQGMFSRDFFDDDSLFGSSSSSSSDEEDGDDDDNDSGSEESEAEEAPAADPLRPAGDSAEETVDDLLAELEQSGDIHGSKRKPIRITTTQASDNPLQLAERHAQNQTNTTRKTWASTARLPIRDFHETVPNPALTFPFVLDPFQQQAIARLERAESVFVAAHTSAGKTVVAEYAVAMAQQRGTRCVYTSPIKALSNQKFRDFSLKFGAQNIGLITGDLQVNADDSTCLIMTTEILRSMLYRGADLIRDIEYVIFDEVHYINDTERGVVWEEVIIMLPSYVNLVFLSATTPNTLEFSDWIGRTKRRPVYVVTTNYRPVPLSFNLWAGSKLHCIMEGRSGFLDKGYSSAAKAMLPASAKDKDKKDGKSRPPARPATGSKHLAWQQSGTKQNWNSLVRFLEREELMPAVVFSFSKKKCEEIANMLRSLDLNTAKESSAVQGFAIQTVARLSQNDAKLPQVQMVCEMVKRGFGVHHGGLLPILKEMVEILFSRSLVKVLFATETFAMGVNMPARCVVFNSIRKHDGKNFRQLEPGELTQMAGRAGRRGLDDVGTVIMCCFGETPPPQPILKQMLTGSSTRLNSQFRLTYNMILNLLRVEEMSVESMIKRSFSEFATQRALTANEYPQLLSRGVKALEKLEAEDKVRRIGVEDIESYYASCASVMSSNAEILSGLRLEDAAAFEDVFQRGRVVFVTATRKHGVVRAPAVVLLCRSGSRNVSAKPTDSTECPLVCLILLSAGYTSSSETSQKPGSIGYTGTSRHRFYSIVELAHTDVLFVTSLKYKLDFESIYKDGNPAHSAGTLGRDISNPFAGMKVRKKGDDADNPRQDSVSHYDEEVGRAVDNLIDAESTELAGAGAPIFDLRGSLKRGDNVLHFRQVFDETLDKINQMRSFPSHRHPNLETHFGKVDRKETLRGKVETLRHLLSNESLQLFPDFLQRKAVLRELGYVDANETVCIKGRVACEANSCEELIVTEIVFEGLLNDLEPEEIAAVLSALIFQERKESEFDAELPQQLVDCCNKMKAIAVNLGALQQRNGLSVNPDEYATESLKFGLVHVVYEWALGVPFQNICELSDVQEGSIVRTITRLDELCREVRNCARVVGNPTLYRKLEAASVAIKRDIVFASSLYVS